MLEHMKVEAPQLLQLTKGAEGTSDVDDDKLRESACDWLKANVNIWEQWTPGLVLKTFSLQHLALAIIGNIMQHQSHAAELRGLAEMRCPWHRVLCKDLTVPILLPIQWDLQSWNVAVRLSPSAKHRGRCQKLLQPMLLITILNTITNTTIDISANIHVDH